MQRLTDERRHMGSRCGDRRDELCKPSIRGFVFTVILTSLCAGVHACAATEPSSIIPGTASSCQVGADPLLPLENDSNVFSLRKILHDKYSQKPQLSTSHRIVRGTLTSPISHYLLMHGHRIRISNLSSNLALGMNFHEAARCHDLFML